MLVWCSYMHCCKSPTRASTYIVNSGFRDMTTHTKHIITRWDAALPGSWVTSPLNEGLVKLDRWSLCLSNIHEKCRGKARMDSKDEHGQCFGCGDHLFYDSWGAAKWCERHSGPGSPTIGPGVHSSAPSPEERLDLETDVCPRGRSHSSRYWPGTGTDWMSSMSLIRYLNLKMFPS